MVEHHASYLDTVFHALSDATRRSMLEALAQGERSVSELAAPFDMSLAAGSKHVKVLESAGLIERRVVGRTHFCSLSSSPLERASEWIGFFEHFWKERLDALELALSQRSAREGGLRQDDERE